MSFGAGVAVGFAMGKKMFEGGGGVDTPDPDYQKWLDLPEPNDNQAVFLIRTTTANQSVGMTVNSIFSPTTYENSFSVDWGDGSDLEMFWSYPSSGVSHTYSDIGDHIVTFTNLLGYNDFAKPKNLIMAKYGDGMCVHLIKSSDGTTTNNFSSWNSLRYIKLPRSTEFNNRFFESCAALKRIEFEGDIHLFARMFYQCHNLDFSNINFASIIQVPDYCFTGCIALKNVSFPSCTSVGNSSFGQCYNLKNVSLPSCTSVGNYTFSSCYDLESISLPSCTSVGNETFNVCYNLRNVEVPEECVFGLNVFRGCYKLSPRPDGTEY